MLAAAALLAPLEQADLHTLDALNKHVGLGLWFAAIAAGYAVDTFIAAAPDRPLPDPDQRGRASSPWPSPSPSASASRTPSPPAGPTRPASSRSSARWPPTAAGPCWSKTRPSPSTTCPPATSGSAGPPPATSSCPPAASTGHPTQRPASPATATPPPSPATSPVTTSPSSRSTSPTPPPWTTRIRADLSRSRYYRIVDVVPYGIQAPLTAPTSSYRYERTERDHHRPRSAPEAPPGDARDDPRLVLPPPPDDIEKYGYLQRNLPYLTTILAISATCLIISQIRFETPGPGALAVHDLHRQLRAVPGGLPAGELQRPRLRPGRPPGPYRGVEPAGLSPTWTSSCRSAASRSRCCATPGRRSAGCWPPTRAAIQAYVLDDGPSDEAQDLAASLGLALHPAARPAGAQEERQPALRLRPTSSEFIVILDADFAPRPDFLAETLPYMDDPALAIVQTPQFFRESPDQSWLENAAGSVQEVFYRAIQVGPRPVRRGRLRRDVGGLPADGAGGAGRRGPDPLRRGRAHRPQRHAGRLVHHGMCPSSCPPGSARQPGRVRAPAVPLVRRERGHRVLTPAVDGPDEPSGPAHVRVRLLLLRLHRAAGLLRPAAPRHHARVPAGRRSRLRNFVILLPAFVTGAVLYPLWHRARYGPSVWPLGIARGWAHVFSLWDGARGKQMSWHPTREPGSSLPRFRIGVTWWSGGMAVLVGAAGHLAVGHGLAGSPPPCCSSGCSTSPSSAGSSSPERRQHEIPAGARSSAS